MKFRRHSAKRGQNLIEITAVFVVSAILAVAGFSTSSNYAYLKQALQAGTDLRTIEQAQKIAVINGLNNPPALSGYGTSAWPITLATMEANNAVPPSLSIIQAGWTVNTTTIPPTLNIDASPGLISNPYAGTPKNPNVNQSGDGMFDVGHDSFYSLAPITN